MKVPSSTTVVRLRELLIERGLVSSKWMVYYIKKHEALKILEVEKPVNSRMVEVLRERQGRHMSKAVASRKRREMMFGIAELTRDEMVQRLVVEHPGLKFSEVKTFSDGFESATGYRRGKQAIVFVDDSGDQVMLTKSEAKMAESHGIRIPSLAYTSSAPDARTKTFKDIFR